jgi:hypothetical protein
MNDTKPFSVAEVGKHSLIAFIVGSIFALFLLLLSSIASILLRLPGLRMLRKASIEEASILESGIRRSSLEPTLTGGFVTGEVETLRADMLKALVKRGVSETLAKAMVHLRERLMLADWNNLITKTSMLVRQGYEADLVALSLKLVIDDPTAEKLDLLKLMVDQGVEDYDLLRQALTEPGYGAGEFEAAIRLNKVYLMEWGRAFRKSLC